MAVLSLSLLSDFIIHALRESSEREREKEKEEEQDKGKGLRDESESKANVLQTLSVLRSLAKRGSGVVLPSSSPSPSHSPSHREAISHIAKYLCFFLSFHSVI